MWSSSPIPDTQSAQNRSTAGQWQLYGSHRQALERLLVPAQRGVERLCVLGAGNCNDLDLPWLTQAYREVHLVDLDPEALHTAVRRQKLDPARAPVLHAPVDLTGAAETVSRWDGRKPDEREASLYMRQSETSPLPQLGEFDVVLSPCVLSQLIFPLRELLGGEHPSYPAVRAAIRARHLRLMHSLFAPGGRAILLLDLASSRNFPDLPRVSDDQLSDLMRRLVDNRKIFTGLQPAAIEAALNDLPETRGDAASLRFTPPWRWHLSLHKSFLVYAATWRKRQQAVAESPSLPSTLRL